LPVKHPAIHSGERAAGIVGGVSAFVRIFNMLSSAGFAAPGDLCSPKKA